MTCSTRGCWDIKFLTGRSIRWTEAVEESAPESEEGGEAVFIAGGNMLEGQMGSDF